MITNLTSTVKLRIYFACLICTFNLFPTISSEAAQDYAVQLVASKKPLDVKIFAKKHGIEDSIREIKSGDWYKYVTGNFENLLSASQYSIEISLKTGISDAFPIDMRKISEIPGSTSSPDTVKPTPQKEEIIHQNDSANSKYQESGIKNNLLTDIQEKYEKPQGVINSLILWITGDKNITKLKSDLINYGNNKLPLFLRDTYVKLIEKTYNYPIILLFIILIFFFITNVILILLVLYYSNKQKNHRERYVRIYRSLYEDILRSYLFGEIDWGKALLKFKKLNNPLNRKILTSVLLTFKENLRGEMDTQIPDIFVKLGLDKDSLKLAESPLYYRKVQGIRELTNLYPESAMKIIPDYLNNSHNLVRTESQVSYIRLNPEKPFEFLRTLTSSFPRWTQLSSFYLLRLHQLPIPAFVDYLDSELPTVRNFCLRMIIFFQQLENAGEIFKLLNSPLEMTRFLAIRAINDLRLYDGKQLVKDLYFSETEKNKIEIIRALKNIGTEDDFDFLESIIRSDSITLKTEACRSLYYMNDEGEIRLNFLAQNADLNIELYLAHITDPRN